MNTATLIGLLLHCAPGIDPGTARALIQVESSGNPWAIGVVGGALLRQPRNRAEALATARALRADGWNFSVGLGQINQANFERLGLDIDTAFEPCANLAAMQTVLQACFQRAERKGTPEQTALRQALSCYYSGNFSTGFRHGYVARVVAAATTPMPAAGLSAATDPPARTAKEPS
jgi:type IV secretion system protein VirB1